LGEAALYARAGAIVPLLPPGVESLIPSDGLTDLAEVQDQRVLRVFLGAAGSFSDRGATYQLESDGAPNGPLTLAGGGTMTASSARSLTARATPNSTLDAVDPGGRHQRLTSNGLRSSAQLEVELRW